MGRFRVLPLNSPPHFPRYNGGIEKSIRDLKAELAERQRERNPGSDHFTLLVEMTTHDLNHVQRRCLNGRTPCAVFHDERLRRCWSLKERNTIFRLLLARFADMIGKTPDGDRRKPATTWRIVVEHWLRCQNLIVVRHNQKQKVSTDFPAFWSHN